MSDPTSAEESEKPASVVPGRFHPPLAFQKTQPNRWNLARAQHERHVEKEIGQMKELERQAAFDREQQARSNAQRLKHQDEMIHLVEGLIVAAVVLCALFILFADDPDTKDNAWSILTLILGGVVGAAAGYLTGRSGK